MGLIRFGRPEFLRDTALGLAAGAAAGVALSVVVVATGFGEWGEVLYDTLISLVLFYAVALVGRLLMHGIHDLTYRGGLGTRETRQDFLYLTRYGLWLGAGGPAAGGVMALTYRLFGPDAG